MLLDIARDICPAVEEFALEAARRELPLHPVAPMAVGDTRIGGSLLNGEVVLAGELAHACALSSMSSRAALIRAISASVPPLSG